MKNITAVLLMAICCVLFSACHSEKNKTEITAPTTQPTTSEITTAATITQPVTHTATGPTAQVPGATAFREPETAAQRVAQTENTEEETAALQMTIGGTPVAVDWEDNAAVQALTALCRNRPLTIQMSMYGGFEQVGSIGTDLPQNDVQTTASSGDVVLYAGDQMVVFYGSNSWAYTRLGHITDKTQAELTELLANGNVTVTLRYS